MGLIEFTAMAQLPLMHPANGVHSSFTERRNEQLQIIHHDENLFHRLLGTQ
jgi:hypothetical protein